MYMHVQYRSLVTITPPRTSCAHFYRRFHSRHVAQTHISRFRQDERGWHTQSFRILKSPRIFAIFKYLVFESNTNIEQITLVRSSAQETKDERERQTDRTTTDSQLVSFRKETRLVYKGTSITCATKTQRNNCCHVVSKNDTSRLLSLIHRWLMHISFRLLI